MALSAIWCKLCVLMYFFVISCVTVEVSPTNSRPSSEKLDWNLYEMDEQQALEYDGIEQQHKDSMVNQFKELEKNAELDDKMYDIFPHDILKRESIASSFVVEEARKKSTRKKMSGLRTHDIFKRETVEDSQNTQETRKQSSPRQKRSGDNDRARDREVTINGGWSPWSMVATPCNASCGGGKMVRRRSCSNPRPQVSNKFLISQYTIIINFFASVIPCFRAKLQ